MSPWQEAKWTVEAQCEGETLRYTCNFLFVCGGYYKYAAGYTPAFPGVERFAGRIVHRQNWTADVDHAGKRVVVIGSGATAVTLVPEMAKTVAHVTMPFTEKGLKLASGKALEADLIVTATGLNLEVLAGIDLTVDGALTFTA